MLRFVPLCAVLLAANASAQAVPASGSTLVGRVLDNASGAPVTGAEVEISPQGVRLLTDSLGAFRAVGHTRGVYTISIKRVGFQQISDFVTVGPEAESPVDFRMTRLVTLDTLEARAKGVTYRSPALRGFEERRAFGHGHFITEAELRKFDDRTLGNVLRRVPGVSISLHRAAEYAQSRRSPGGGRAGALTQSGAPSADPNDRHSPRGCWVAVYLDGAALYLGPPQPAPNLAQILVRELAGVEFNSGSATLPAQFSRDQDIGLWRAPALDARTVAEGLKCHSES
jgi:hypothetical protein